MFTIEVAFFTAAALVLLVWMRYLTKKIETTMINSMWAVEDRADKTASKVEKMELRAMMYQIRLHEVVRLVMQMLDEFQIDGDSTWLPRQLGDLMTHVIEVRMRHLGGTRADSESLIRFIMRIVVDRSLNLT